MHGAPNFKCGMVSYDVSGARKRWPWNWLGRKLGGCHICGTLWPGYWCNGDQHVCGKCWDNYVEIKVYD